MADYGDVTYNSRRSILGAIPLGQEIAYHLFTIDTSASNAGGIVKLNRKSKWHSQYNPQKGRRSLFSRYLSFRYIQYLLKTLHLDNFVVGFDFNTAGDSIATIDHFGVCFISDVNTNNYGFYLQVGNENSDGGNSEF